MKLKFNRQQIFLSCLTLLFVFVSAISRNGAIALPGSPSNLPKLDASSIAQSSYDSAREIFEEAYANRYTWDTDFPGYVAEISVQDGETTDQGVVRVAPNLNVAVSEIEDEEMQQFLQEQVQMETIHRRRVDFERLHGENQFRLNGEDENGALRIQEIEPNSVASYLVNNRQILQVNRSFGEIAVTVNVMRTMETAQGYLTNHFQAIYKDAASGEILEQEDVQDTHEQVGNYYLLKRREIRRDKVNNPAEKALADVVVEFDNFQDYSVN